MVGINGAAFAQRLDGWEFLGATRIGGFGFDRDEIKVGKRRGHFEKSRVRARSNGVYVRSLRVVYGNDEKQDIRMGRRLREGQQTASIELEDRERFIKRIELSYGSKPSVRGQPVVCVFGRQ
jgi:hypothetical protein